MPNRLHDATSPYLLQHADQPVDWYPWGEEALRMARDEDRPILLSIGYAACHWCHVMAHESFDDDEIARRMNAWFVNIKVDREARPDLDRTYQLAHQVLTGQGGGWPLTLFLDPTDLAPFAAGTYFPPQARDGRVGFRELLERVHGAWLEQRDALRAQNRKLNEAMGLLASRSADAAPETEGLEDPGDTLIGQLEAREDARHGGFGQAPKFPQVPLLAWLVERGLDDPSAERMLLDALRAIVRNGLADQIGGGFFRYCTDAAWEVPHFEKMLADNAQLIDILASAATRWDDSELAEAAVRTVEFLERDLALAKGGFATSLDADSPVPRNHLDPDEPIETDRVPVAEGAHYRWRPDDIDDALEPALAELARARFGLDGPANLSGGFWHPVQARSIGELTAAGQDADSTAALVEQARLGLLDARSRRAPPQRDSQLRAGLNGMAAAALARAGQRRAESTWVQRADETLARVWDELLEHSPPCAVFARGTAEHPLLLDDLAALLDAELALLDARFGVDGLDRARRLADWIERDYFDPQSGRFTLTAHGQVPVLVRPRSDLDEAVPSGAAQAVRGWLRLARLDENPRFRALGAQALAAIGSDVQQQPAAHATWLRARRELDNPAPQIVLGGPDEPIESWAGKLARRIDRRVCRIPQGLSDLPTTLQAASDATRPQAWICLADRCLEPLESVEAIDAALESATASFDNSLQ